MRPIQTCQSIEEVRTHIDRIDRDIVALLAERSNYVMQVVGFKKTEEDVHATARAEQVVSRAVSLARKFGANPDVTERIYRAMIKGFVEFELAELASRENSEKN